MNGVVADIIKVDGGVLIQPPNYLRRGYSAIHDVLSMLPELVVDIEGNQQGPEDAEQNEEVVRPQLASFDLGHHWIFPELLHLVSPQGL